MEAQLVVYCNANSEEGYGHFFRCLNIVRHLKKEEDTIPVAFAGDYTELSKEALRQYGIPFYPVTLDSLLNDTYKKVVPVFKYLLFDSYLVDQLQLDALFEKFKVLLVDDFNTFKTGQAYGILNFTINAPNFTYTASNKLLGLAYFPYRPELEGVRSGRILENKRKIHSENKTILLFFSGKQIDHSVLLNFMNCLDQYFTGCVFKIIGGFLKDVKIQQNTVEVVPYRIDIEKYYEEADIIISGGGLVKYEAAFCAIPNFSVAVTEAQHKESLYFQENNLTFEIGTLYNFDKKYCLERLNFFFENTEIYTKMIQASEEKFSQNRLATTIHEMIA